MTYKCSMRIAGLVGWAIGTAFTLWMVFGCTHLVQESAQPVHISSEPSGATVYLGTVQQAERTPMTVTLDPRRTYEVRLEKDCYASYPTVLRPGMGLREFGTVKVPVSQLKESLHAHLQPTCPSLVAKEKR